MKWILIFLTSALFAFDLPLSTTVNKHMLDDNTTKIDAISGKAVNGNLDQANAPLVNEDEIVDTNIPTGKNIFYNAGSLDYTYQRDETGRVVVKKIIRNSDGTQTLIDMNSSKSDFTPEDVNASENASKTYRSIVRDRELLENNMTDTEMVDNLLVEDRVLLETKKTQLQKVNSGSANIRNIEQITVGDAIVNTGGNTKSIFTNDIRGLKAKQDAGTELTQGEQNELNATIFYNENVSDNPKYNSKKLMSESQTTDMHKGFQSVEPITQQLTARINNLKLQCYISRDLIPNFTCPISGLEHIRYPLSVAGTDMRKVDVELAKKECDDICRTQRGFYPIITERIIDNADLNITFSDFEIMPTFLESNKILTIDNDDRMPLEYIEMEFEMVKPSSMTEADWLKWLKDKGPRMKYSIVGYSEYLEKDGTIKTVANVLTKKEEIYFISSIIRKKVIIGTHYTNHKVQFNNPYFKTYADQAEFINMGAVIRMTDISAKYTSRDYHYCSFRQAVQNSNECFGGLSNVYSFMSAGQLVNICHDMSHKIGPEALHGAFFSNSAAEDQCFNIKECLATYSQYSGGVPDDQVIYQAKIGCVDNPENVECTTALCEEYFATAEDNKVLSEKVLKLKQIPGQDLSTYTILNGSRVPNTVRPKIDWSELNSSTSVNYDEVFKSEEKDAAYMYMLNNLNYNRFKYRIGEASPAKLAYKTFGSAGDKGIKAVLKPDSFNYNDGSFYVYGIMVVDHQFVPLAGAWVVDGNNISISTANGVTTSIINNQTSVTSTDLISDQTSAIPRIGLRDRTYLYKTGGTSPSTSWTPFRRIQFDKLYVENTVQGIDNGILAEGVENGWVNLPAYKIDRFEKFVNNNFVQFDKNENAEHFMTSTFSSDMLYTEYTLAESYGTEVVSSPGLLIRDQLPTNNGTTFERVYTGPYLQYSKSNLFNVSYYLIYSKTRLSYAQILNEIEGEDWQAQAMAPIESPWIVWDTQGHRMLPENEVEPDGVYNNGIKIFMKGKPENLTFDVDWGPKNQEKGQKVFKFTFLFTDDEIADFEYE